MVDDDNVSETNSDNVDDAFMDVREATHVEEAAEIASLVAQVVATEGESCLASYTRVKQILDRYQEQSQLLDPILEGFISPLVGLLRTLSRRCAALNSAAAAAEYEEMKKMNVPEEVRSVLRQAVLVSRLLNAVVTVRGHKTALRFFGHEAQDFEPAVNLLQWAENADQSPSASAAIVPAVVHETGGGLWELKRILLLWLSILALIPFDLSTVDSSVLKSGGQVEASTIPPLVHRLISLCKLYLSDPGGVREAAAILLGRLLTRPDVSSGLLEFLQWCGKVIKHCEGGVRAPFLLCGSTQALACIYKVGQRSALLKSVESVWPLACLLTESSEGEAETDPGKLSLPTLLSRNALARKLSIKFLQRLGLVLMEPRVASWRYQKGGANLLANLGASATSDASATAREEEQDIVLDDYIADRAEELVGSLLGALRDRDTVVRWSAAKGLGRVVNRLPRDFADDVVHSILEMFAPTEPDTAWHGACLALAELCRRGLLLPERLSSAAPLVAKALSYDVRRGAHSVGSHVRDAAAYCCWAFARAYSPSEVEGAVKFLAPALLVTACYDREVNCRRAASAAFQECAGRLGNFPHGIEILTAADYFALSVRAHAYLEVAPFIAGFPEYTRPMITHLIDVKLRHWDPQIRALTSKALAALVKCDPVYMSTQALEVLLPLSVDPVLEVRHGSTLALAELVLALRSPVVTADAVPSLSEDLELRLTQVVPEIEKNRLYRGKGGEAMRAAVGRFIECAALAAPALNFDFATRRLLMNTMDENLKHPTTGIRDASVRALSAFTRAFMNEEKENFIQRTTLKYLGFVKDPNPAARRGYTAALGALPRTHLSPKIDQVVDDLIAATKPEDNPDEQDAESRVAAVQSLISICTEVFATGPSVSPTPYIEHGRMSKGLRIMLERVVPALLVAMADYSTDKRGDVGSWVREASMHGLSTLLRLCTDLAERISEIDMQIGAVTEGGEERTEEMINYSMAVQLTGDMACSATAAMLKQMVERIGRVRETGAACLIDLLEHRPLVPGILHRSELESLFLLSGRPEPLPALMSNGEALEELLGLLPTCKAYVGSVVEGLAASIGGVDAILAGKCAQAVGALVVRFGDDLARSIMISLLGVWSRNERSQRMATPVMKTFDALFTRGLFRAVTKDSAFLDRLMELTRGEIRQCKDIPRLLAAATLLAHVVDAEDVASVKRSLQSILVMLVNRYPRVRKATAEQLYLRLVAIDDPEAKGIKDLDGALDALGGTAWDGDAEQVKKTRNELYGVLGIEPPATTSKAAGDEEPGRAAAAKKEAADRLTYQSLLNDAARGLM